MKQFFRYVTARNPVWVVPLALPVVLYGSQSVEQAILFGVTLGILVPLVHGISYFAESWLPRMLRILPVLIISGTLVTIAEIVVINSGVLLAERPALMFRAISVSGIMIWPTIRARRGERFNERLQVVLGLTVGFLLGFVVFTAVRVSGNLGGIGLSNSVALGFFILALGRIAINLARSVSESEKAPEEERNGGHE